MPALRDDLRARVAEGERVLSMQNATVSRFRDTMDAKAYTESSLAAYLTRMGRSHVRHHRFLLPFRNMRNRRREMLQMSAEDALSTLTAEYDGLQTRVCGIYPVLLFVSMKVDV